MSLWHSSLFRFPKLTPVIRPVDKSHPFHGCPLHWQLQPPPLWDSLLGHKPSSKLLSGSHLYTTVSMLLSVIVQVEHCCPTAHCWIKSADHQSRASHVHECRVKTNPVAFVTRLISIKREVSVGESEAAELKDCQTNDRLLHDVI